MDGARPLTQAEEASVTAFPVLRRLIDLRDAGWTFMPRFADDGEVLEVKGFQGWDEGWADAIRVHYATESSALRCNYLGDLVWQREGTLDEVVDALLTLPAPNMPNAPHLVLGHVAGRAPRLWTP